MIEADQSRPLFSAAGWWDQDGTHSLLHVINPTRLAYVKERVGSLAGKQVADIGCGGGIFAEALAKAGASVVGIDTAAAVIDTARTHAKQEALPIDYRVGNSASLAATMSGAYDVVTCMEMLEHVPDPAAEIRTLAALLRPGGALFLATINQTPLAYASMIIGLEKVLQALPDGAHKYSSFLPPSKVGAWCHDADLRVRDVVGVNWSFFGKTFLLSRLWMPVNYFVHTTKN